MTRPRPDIDVSELRAYAQGILDALQCAEDCETPTDLVANLEEVIDTAKLLQKEAKSVLDEVKEELGK